MSNWQYLSLDRQDRVLTVRFDAGSRVNGLSHELMRELTRLAVELREDAQLSAIVLTGRDDMFSAGMDLRDPESAAARELTRAEQRLLHQVGPKMCAAWEALEPVTIAAIEGWCIGGGSALAVSCDWRVAADDSHLYVPEIRLGMNMSWQSVPRFVNLIGPAKTKELLILAEPLPAATALDWGLVDHLAEPGQVLAKSQELAGRVAAMPPIPVRMIKRGITETATALNNASSFMDADQFMSAQQTEDAREGILAFLEKRDPRFRGN
jgi:enoyl-CoA hydratase/carnithine racemase